MGGGGILCKTYHVKGAPPQGIISGHVHFVVLLQVLSFEDGSVEIHQLSEQYSIQRENENQIFGDYLFSLVM